MKICFVTLEIAPTTWGGAGVLISEATKVLTDRGHEVVLILDVPRYEYETFQWEDRLLAYQHPERVRAYHVSELCVRLPPQWATQFGNEHLWRSYRLHWATKQVAALERPDVIEFADYLGMAYHALSAKITQGTYSGIHLAVRLHNSIEVMEAHQAMRYSPSRHVLYALEHQALRFAEHILYPSPYYLDEAYKPFYRESWLGELHHSPPALTDPPIVQSRYGEPNLILFYGRLFGFKGVDHFVDAAVSLLVQEIVPAGIQFVLVGNDSDTAPDGGGSYQEYLIGRIPMVWGDRFEFPGHVDRDQLEDLLPRVLFAVFPNQFESFGYAVHEIYEAGIPVIVNDIPAFRDYFRHRENALVTDGTGIDLSEKMFRLLEDSTLRERLRGPKSVVGTEVGEFYESPGDDLWSRPISSDEKSDISRLVLCVINDDLLSTGLYETGASVSELDSSVIVLSSTRTGERDRRFRFLGKTYTSYDEYGLPTRKLPSTLDYLLMVRAGDLIQNGYLRTAVQILDRCPELSFVGAWKRVLGNDGRTTIDPFPIDCLLETLPFADNPVPTRVVMRTKPGTALPDLFDPQLEDLGELEYLWRLEDTRGPGVVIPEALITIHGREPEPAEPALRSLMIIQELNLVRLRKIARYQLSRIDERRNAYSVVDMQRYREDPAQ